MPADDPCMGFAIAPSGMYETLEQPRYKQEVGELGHGTAVASALGGKRVGIAKNVNIVPIKVFRCDRTLQGQGVRRSSTCKTRRCFGPRRQDKPSRSTEPRIAEPPPAPILMDRATGRTVTTSRSAMAAVPEVWCGRPFLRPSG